MNNNYSLGVDIGGTKIAVALVDTEGNILFREERLSRTESADLLFETLVDCMNEVLSNSKTTLSELNGIGVGIPGKVDIENGIAIYQNNIPWENFPLKERLEMVFGEHLNIYIDNDVKMAAYAEYITTQKNPKDLFTYVTISTGIAATSIVNRKIIRGAGFSGEIGFIPLKNESGYISLEEFASGPGIVESIPRVKTAKEVFEKARKGDKELIKILDERAHAIALGLYSIICVLDPASIVIGGSVAYYNPEFIDEVRNKLSEYTVPEQSHILKSLKVSRLGGDNGIIGAGLRAFKANE